MAWPRPQFGGPPSTPHRISLRLAARLLRLPLKGGVIRVQTENMVYIMPGNRARSLVQASRITPPLRGSRREGGARSRAGGGQTPRPVSDYQRQEQRSLGGVLRVLEGYRQVSWRTLCQLNRTSITQASLFSPSPGSTLILGSCASWRSGPSRRRARRPPRRRARPDPPRTAYTRARGLNSPAGWPRPVCGANTRSWCRAGS